MRQWSRRKGAFCRLILTGLLVLCSVGCRTPARPSSVTEGAPAAIAIVTWPATAQQVTPTLMPGTEIPTAVASPSAQMSESRLSPSSSPTATRTPTSTAIPTPTHTLAPDMHLRMAERAMTDGDYPMAIRLWREALATADPSKHGVLEISLARAHAEEGRHHDAVSLLARVITGTASSREQAEALGLLACSYEALGEWRAAIDAFERYLELEDAAEPYVRWHLAQALEALGEDEQASDQLASIDLAHLSLPLQAEILEEIATVHRRLGDYGGALAAYQQILDFSRHENYRALVLQKQGETLREGGKEADAVETLQRVLDERPESYAAYLALLSLDDMEAAAITDLQRGEILYHASQYAECLKALRRYEYANPEGDLARAHHHMGLAYERLGQFGRAFQEYDLVIEHYPRDPLAADAWMAKARAAEAYGGDPSGIYNEFWRRFRDHRRAPEALWRGALALESRKAWGRAAEFHGRLRTLFPDDERAKEALFREGLAAYLTGDADTAGELWEDAPKGDLSSEKRSRILTWLGLAAKASGEPDRARHYWQEAMEASPWSYYGLRARDLDAGLPPRHSPTASSTLPDGSLTESDWRQIGAWMRSWHQASGEDHVKALNDSLVRRGDALLRIGWHEEALTTFRLLRDQARNDPGQLAALARLADDGGLYPIAIYCAERLADLGLEAGDSDPPKALLRLAYPTTFGHLIAADSERYAIDPLLFLALIRQESRFNPRAVSYAGAMGLTQVMPSTGTWIASRIGPAAYRQEFLTRPIISVRYGFWFLRTLLDLYDQDWFAALVAYNAGPGNLKRWTSGQPIADHDLFYETIPAAQAKEYVRQVYQQYRMYERIYRSDAPG